MTRQVKRAGNAENTDLSRIGQSTGKAYARLEEYRLVRAIRLESFD